MSDLASFINELNGMIKDNSSEKKAEANKVESTVQQPQTQQQPQQQQPQQPQPSLSVNNKTKLLIVSTHINQANSHAKQVHNLLSYLSGFPNLSLVHFGTHKHVTGNFGRKYPSNVKVVDVPATESGPNSNGLGFLELPKVIQAEKPDIVLLYSELVIVCTYIEEIRKHLNDRNFKIWALLDVKHFPIQQSLIDVVNRDIEQVFCTNKYWKSKLKSLNLTRPVEVLKYSVNSTISRSIPTELARNNVGLPRDIFLFQTFQKNVPRKRLDLLITAFVKLIVKFPIKPIFLLILADKGDKGGYNIFEIYSRELKLANASIELFGNRLMLSSANCLPDTELNVLMNAGNVGITCSDGDGFGINALEHLSCGVPQIVPDIAGYSEFCGKNNALLVKPSHSTYLPMVYSPTGGIGQEVSSDDLSKQMERYVFDDDMRKNHAQNARDVIKEYTPEKSYANLIHCINKLSDD
jgi:glycosyltransferase involved in cell wall biosynthesis